MAVKTLHITNHYHPSSGGIRTFYHALLNAADRHRREVCLVVPGTKDALERVGEFGRIYTIAAPPCPAFDSRYHLLLPHLYALPYPSTLRRILQTEQPDLVEVCDKFALSGVPSVLRRRWIKGVAPAVLVGLSCERLDDNVSAYISEGPLAKSVAGWYLRKMYATRFDCHISNSDYTAGELTEALTNRPEIPVLVRPMGVDCAGFSPSRRSPSAQARLLSQISVAPSETRVRRLLLYVGRISPEKNIDLLVDVMALLAADSSAEYHLLFAGDGPRTPRLRETAPQRVPGRIHFLGHVADRERLADLYANCDALVHPNPREPFGIAPLEAMASGLPVVAPNAGGVLSYANRGNSWLAPPTPRDFASRVCEVFADEQARVVKVECALRTAANFDWPRIAGIFFDLYDELCVRFRPPRHLLTKGITPLSARSEPSAQAQTF